MNPPPPPPKSNGLGDYAPNYRSASDIDSSGMTYAEAFTDSLGYEIQRDNASNGRRVEQGNNTRYMGQTDTLAGMPMSYASANQMRPSPSGYRYNVPRESVAPTPPPALHRQRANTEYNDRSQPRYESRRPIGGIPTLPAREMQQLQSRRALGGTRRYQESGGYMAVLRSALPQMRTQLRPDSEASEKPPPRLPKRNVTKMRRSFSDNDLPALNPAMDRDYPPPQSQARFVPDVSRYRVPTFKSKIPPVKSPPPVPPKNFRARSASDDFIPLPPQPGFLPRDNLVSKPSEPSPPPASKITARAAPEQGHHFVARNAEVSFRPSPALAGRSIQPQPPPSPVIAARKPSTRPRLESAAPRPMVSQRTRPKKSMARGTKGTVRERPALPSNGAVSNASSPALGARAVAPRERSMTAPVVYEDKAMSFSNESATPMYVGYYQPYNFKDEGSGTLKYQEVMARLKPSPRPATLTGEQSKVGLRTARPVGSGASGKAARSVKPEAKLPAPSSPGLEAEKARIRELEAEIAVFYQKFGDAPVPAKPSTDRATRTQTRRPSRKPGSGSQASSKASKGSRATRRPRRTQSPAPVPQAIKPAPKMREAEVNVLVTPSKWGKTKSGKWKDNAEEVKVGISPQDRASVNRFGANKIRTVKITNQGGWLNWLPATRRSVKPSNRSRIPAPSGARRRRSSSSTNPTFVAPTSSKEPSTSAGTSEITTQHLQMNIGLAPDRAQKYAKIFQDEGIDKEALMLLSEQDLRELGIAMGPRKKIIKYTGNRG